MSNPNHRPSAWPVAGPFFLWLVRLLALVAGGCAAYLAYVTVTGATAAGCGDTAQFDCGSVLASPHATWLGIPVSSAAVIVYLAIFAVTWIRIRTWPLLIFGVTTAGSSGLWFIAQQVATEQFCPYCLATHACGLLLVGAVIGRLVANSAKSTVRTAVVSAALGLVPTGLLVVGQTLFPADRSDIARGHQLPPDPPGVLTVLEGKHRIDLHDVPILGRPDASTVLVKLFDYTCPHCKKMHRVLEEFDQRYGDRVAIVMAPIPLAKTCNRLMKGTHPKHKDSCVFARYALAVWRADPTHFFKFHEWMFLRPATPSIQSARSHAVRLVGEEAFVSALRDPWIDAQIQQFINMWEDCNPRMVPKILTRRHEAKFDPPDLIHPFMEELLGDKQGQQSGATAP